MSDKKIIMNDETKRYLSDPQNMPPEIRIHGKSFFPKEFVSSEGFKSVVWKGLDNYDSPIAIKLATYEDYIERSYLDEARKTAKLRKYDEFAFFHEAAILDLDLGPLGKRKFVCFIEEWVKGCTLFSFIETNEISVQFIMAYIRGMATALNILYTLGLMHDDLHLRNVMIVDPKKGTLTDEYTIKIIDTGSLKSTSSEQAKPLDDHQWFARHIIELFNGMLFVNNRRRVLSLAEKRFRREAFRLISSMLEEDRSVALFEPLNIIEQFEHAYIRAQNPYKDSKFELQDPFDFISAEHIVSDELLVRIFAESCPWVKEVRSPNPILLTGPRGCGKSMIFRRMSLKGLLYRPAEEIQRSQIAGFYISCSSELRNKFGWIKSERMAIRFRNEIIHYFNLLLSREIVHTLSLVSRRDDAESLYGFGKIQAMDLYENLVTRLHIEQIHLLRLQGSPPLDHLVELITRQMYNCYDAFLQGNNLRTTTPISFISDLTRFLSRSISYFKNRKIAFLLDDYSIHRISESVQKIINQIIWDRQATHIFKLSAEVHGADRIFDTINGADATADHSREYREIDIGKYYIELSDNQESKIIQDFAKDLLDFRLREAKYKGNSETLIGHSSYGGERTLARALREKSKKYDQYHGIETIAEICSGDVAALLEIYRLIFREGKIVPESNSIVPKKTQHTAIQRASRRFLRLIKTYSPFGQEMYNIVNEFGTLCRKILINGLELSYREKSGRIAYRPRETTRIEVDETSGGSEQWNTIQEGLLKNLVRRAIFIELDPGRGRRTLGPTLRWQLRRIYAPAFHAGLKKAYAIKWNMSEFKYFITNPSDMCDMELKRLGSRDPAHPDLFRDTKGEDHEDEL